MWPLPPRPQPGLSVSQDTRRKLTDSISSKLPVPLNAWTHVADTFDRGRLRLYVNGRQVAEKVVGILRVPRPSRD